MRKLLTLALLAFTMAGCGMVDSHGPTWVRTIGAEGGEVARDNVLLEVPQGAVMTDTVFTIEPAPSVPQGNIGPAYMLAPDNVEFLTPLSIVFSLAREDLPDGVGYESLRVATVEGGKWKVLADSEPDEHAGTVTGKVTHFSIWGVFPIPPPPTCDDVDCDDGDACTTDTCEEGECSYEAIPDCCIPEEEICDGKDNNCDGVVDEGCPDPCDSLNCDDGDECTDDSCVDGECVHQLVPECCIPEPEICDGKDNNCNGFADEDDVCMVEGCDPENPSLCDDGDPCTIDYCVEGDCFHEPDPGCCLNQLELCDGIDNNCNGLVDEGFANIDGEADCVQVQDDEDGVPDAEDKCPTTFNPEQEDNDLDGLGDACDADDDVDETLDEDDCDPFDAEVYPGAPELCDGKDNDCNETADDGDADADCDDDDPPVPPTVATPRRGVCTHPSRDVSRKAGPGSGSRVQRFSSRAADRTLQYPRIRL